MVKNWVELDRLDFTPLKDRILQYKAILFLDLDGTFLNGAIDKEHAAFKILRELERRKILLTVFNSGRPIESLYYLAKDVSVSKELVLGANGTLAGYAYRKGGLQTMVCCRLRAFNIPEVLALLQAKVDPVISPYGTYGLAGTQLIVSTPEAQIASLESVIKQAYEGQLKVTPCWGSFTTHIHHGSTGKGKAIETLGRQLALPKERLVAAGDNHNDLGVADQVAWMIGVENATAELKAEAHYVSQKPGCEGVLEGLQQFLVSKNLLAPDQWAHLSNNA